MTKKNKCNNLCIITTNKDESSFYEINDKPLKPESRRDMRSLAFHFAYAVDRFDYTVPLEEIIKNFKKGFNLDIPDDCLAITMAKGSIDMREELDIQIKPLLKNWKLERLGCCTRLILRLALWELQQPDAIHNVVINEAIELAKAFAEKDAYKFINGILDEVCKKMHLDTSKKENLIAKEETEESYESTTNTNSSKKNK